MISKINLHTHSTFCDGKNSAEEMLIAAIKKGFSALGFSSHCFHPLNPEFYTPEDSLWHIPSENIKAYTKEICRLKEKYSKQIKVYLGFEADYFESPEFGSAIPDKNAYSLYNPDYLIGALHFVNTDKGFYTVDHHAEIVKENLIKLYSKSKGQIDGQKAVCDYFEAERQMLKKGNFDILAHPDLIRKRNGLINFFDENESWYKEEVKATVKEIVRAGGTVEINTGAIARGAMDDFYPSEYFLQLLHDAGVPICINSDAHRTDDLDCAFERAALAAKKVGYKELSYPICGKIESIKI
ncbi:MAG: histidinol-phosphatase [Treponema sp.]|nr:histidinol-phosphatase [Treponema sp.]